VRPGGAAGGRILFQGSVSGSVFFGWLILHSSAVAKAYLSIILRRLGKAATLSFFLPSAASDVSKILLHI
jgi:hypothetical protein